MAKDIPSYETPLKEGLTALNQHSNKKFQKYLLIVNENQQKSFLDEMAYPDPDLSSSEQSKEVKWFSLFRNLTMTGYYTSKVGIEELVIKEILQMFGTVFLKMFWISMVYLMIKNGWISV